MDIAHEAQEAIQGHALQSMIKSDHNSSIFSNKTAKASSANYQSEAVYESHVTSSQTQSEEFFSHQTQQQAASHQSKVTQQNSHQSALTQQAASHLSGVIPQQNSNKSQQQTFHQSEVTHHQTSSSILQSEVQHQSRAIYSKQDNLSFPELEKLAQPPPALPPKTKIMHSPSR